MAYPFLEMACAPHMRKHKRDALNIISRRRFQTTSLSSILHLSTLEFKTNARNRQLGLLLEVQLCMLAPMQTRQNLILSRSDSPNLSQMPLIVSPQFWLTRFFVSALNQCTPWTPEVGLRENHGERNFEGKSKMLFLWLETSCFNIGRPRETARGPGNLPREHTSNTQFHTSLQMVCQTPPSRVKPATRFRGMLSGPHFSVILVIF